MLVNDWSIKDSIAEAWNFVIRKHLGKFIALGLIAGLVAAGISLLFAIPNVIVSLVTLNSAFLRTPVTAAMTGEPLDQVFALILQLYTAWSSALLLVFQSTFFVHGYLDLKTSDQEQYLDSPVEKKEFLTPAVEGEILFNPTDESQQEE